MAKIFLSYRRDDTAGSAGRIYDGLRAHFGPEAVFRDIDNTPLGVDFRDYIDAEVGQCDLVLVVLGKVWAGETGAHRRIDDPRDFVRIEIEAALKRGIPVIPILTDRTKMPTESDLPPSLAGLAYRNAIEVDQGRDFHTHVDRLIRGIEFHFERKKAAAALSSGHSREGASKLPVVPAPERTQSVIPTEIGQPPEPPPSAEPPPGSSSSVSDPSRHPGAKQEVADRSKPNDSGTLSAVGEPEQLPIKTLIAAVRERLNESSRLAAGLALVVLLGSVVYLVTTQRDKRTPGEFTGLEYSGNPGDGDISPQNGVNNKNARAPRKGDASTKDGAYDEDSRERRKGELTTKDGFYDKKYEEPRKGDAATKR